MCKVLMIPNIKDNKREAIIKFTKLMAEEMSFANKDGIGYAAIDSSGNLFGERWLVNKDFYGSENSSAMGVVADLFRGFIKQPYSYATQVYTPKSEYTRFGDGDLSKAAAITLHARMATSAKGHSNTHPFVEGDTSLIHNGVIRNYDVKKLKHSTCDSESILHAYLQEGVNVDITKVDNMAADLVGYYVCGVFSRDENGARILDIFKAHNDRLYATYIPDLETYILTSDKLDIATVCRKMSLQYEEPVQLVDGMIVRIDPFTGDVLYQATFKEGLQFESYQSPTSYWNQQQNLHPTFSTTKESKRKNYTKEVIDYMKLPTSIHPVQ